MPKIQIKKFNQLSLKQLYQLLKLRYDVFIFEQQSIFDEFDNIDFDAIHFFIEDNSEIIAYSRLYNKDGAAVLGRIVVKKEYRNLKLGKLIINESIKFIEQQWTSERIKLSAQIQLKKYYESFGFKKVSDEYDDCGIMHIDMELELS